MPRRVRSLEEKYVRGEGMYCQYLCWFRGNDEEDEMKPTVEARFVRIGGYYM